MSLLEALRDSKQKRLDELFTFLRFPSVSAQSKHAADIRKCADWLRGRLSGMGLKCQIMETAGHPVVYAEKIVDLNKPTVLIYGHYDVQPPEPFELWRSGPFSPTLENGSIVARGSTDDKGQIYAHIAAVETHLTTTGTLPLNVKLMIEGEEEISSANLPGFIEKHRDLLKADIVVVSDGSQYAPGQPSVTHGLRGLVFIEIKVTGPNRDVHSGSFGGIINNPLNALCKIVAGLKDADNRVTVEGFYNDVLPTTDFEKRMWAKLPTDDRKFAGELGVPELVGESGFSTLERIWRRPTLDLNGITGGYQGEGAKTIIPSWATCKITMRLVPNQYPKKIMKAASAKIEALSPKGVTVEVFEHDGVPAVETPTDGPWLEAAGRALKTGFGVDPVFMKEGGSIPVVQVFKEKLGLDTLLIGFGQKDDGAHSPNERFRCEDFENGCRTATALLSELGAVKR